MKQPEMSPIAKRFERLTFLFYLMVGLPLLAFSWVYLNMTIWRPWYFFEDPAVGIYGHGVLVVLAIVLTVMAFSRYRKYFQALEPVPQGLRELEALEWKVKVFSQASLQKYLFLTAATLLVVLGFYLSVQQFYVPLYGIMLILFSVNRPTPERLAQDMRMKKEERLVLQEEVMKRG